MTPPSAATWRSGIDVRIRSDEAERSIARLVSVEVWSARVESDQRRAVECEQWFYAFSACGWL